MIDHSRQHDAESAINEHGTREAEPLLCETTHVASHAGQAAAEPAQAADDTASLELEERIVEAIQHVYDPEIPVNVYDLGLIYGIEILPLGRVTIHMTLTSPACPVAGALPEEVEARVRSVEGVTDATVELVWEPPWSVEMMSEEAKVELNLF